MDDVPQQFKKARMDTKRRKTTWSYDALLVSAFASERSEARNIRTNPKGELNLADLGPIEWEKCQKALEKEWSVWTKYDAVDVVPPKKAKQSAPKVLDSRAV